MAKPTKKQRKWVTDTLSEWKGKLFLHEWYIDVSYMAENIDKSGDYTTNADVCTCSVYLKAHIRIYPIFWEDTPEKQVRMLVHELCHCLTQEIWDTANHLRDGFMVNSSTIKDQIERLTQRISTAVFMGDR